MGKENRSKYNKREKERAGSREIERKRMRKRDKKGEREGQGEICIEPHKDKHQHKTSKH